MDLTVPPTAPMLGKYGRYNWDRSTFAIYTLVPTSEQSLHDIASQLEYEWWEEEWDAAVHLVSVAPNCNFEGKGLKDVIISLLLDDVQHVTAYGEFNDGDLHWFPTAFIVLTSNDIETNGPLFVYADPYDELAVCPLDKFHFRLEDAHCLLTSIRSGDEVFTSAKQTYAHNLPSPS
ncbi:hypothetical protein MBLNU459_g2357t1 [Dothideomycetes sp. NU459]